MLGDKIMQYRNFKDFSTSLLGFGCMRFSRKMGFIDQEKVEEQLQYALDQGINYFDTAYIYPGSEALLGAAQVTVSTAEGDLLFALPVAWQEVADHG